ncbi:class I SAM-dependent methyltransferase [Candidatus Pelagibacter sp.]|jgi:SAM-dependent methyltransferase|nr:class I SAM-dependent methyltransferase [Candidatus Pelagibacter sp.]
MISFLKKKFNEDDGLFSFPINDTKTKKVTDFYKETPFPNYKDDETKQSIVDKGNKNLLAQQFKKFIGHNKNVLEVGCGTGQLSIYFAIGTNNEIIAFDPTIESLNLAKNFSKQNEISNIKFVNADIFDDVLSKNYFDFIWCNGVLHHTKNPYKAFEITVQSLKNNGYILVGLYNKIGRVRTLVRKYLSKIFGIKFLELFDPTLKDLKLSEKEKKSWINDQYFHPIESLHTLDEVLDWFKKNDIEYINSIPSCDFENFQNYENIFKKKPKGDIHSRLFNQISMIFNKLGSDGGLFVVIGKKNERN